MSTTCRFCGASSVTQDIYRYSIRHGVCRDCYRVKPQFAGTIVTRWGRVFPESRRSEFTDAEILAISRTTVL